MGVICIIGIFIATRRGRISTQSIKKAQGRSREELHNRGELIKVDRKVVGRSEVCRVHYNDWKTVPSKAGVSDEGTNHSLLGKLQLVITVRRVSPAVMEPSEFLALMAGRMERSHTKAGTFFLLLELKPK